MRMENFELLLQRIESLRVDIKDGLNEVKAQINELFGKNNENEKRIARLEVEVKYQREKLDEYQKNSKDGKKVVLTIMSLIIAGCAFIVALLQLVI